MVESKIASTASKENAGVWIIRPVTPEDIPIILSWMNYWLPDAGNMQDFITQGLDAELHNPVTANQRMVGVFAESPMFYLGFTHNAETHSYSIDLMVEPEIHDNPALWLPVWQNILHHIFGKMGAHFIETNVDREDNEQAWILTRLGFEPASPKEPMPSHIEVIISQNKELPEDPTVALVCSKENFFHWKTSRLDPNP
jgi:hypothetical protein